MCLLLFVLDCSGWFGGLPWRWGWGGRGRGRGAVSEEAAPSELLKANCPLFGRGGRTPSPSHPPSSGRLIGPWPACATRQSHWGDGQRRAPTSLSPSWSLLLSPSAGGEGELLFYWKERQITLCSQPCRFLPLPCNHTLLQEIQKVSSLPPDVCERFPFFLLLHLPVLTSFWTSFFNFCSSWTKLSSSSSILRTDHRGCGGNRCQGGSQLCSVAIATAARKLRYYSNPTGTLTRPHLNSPFSSSSNPNQWAPERERGSQNTTSQCTNCSAGQSG